VTSLWRLRTRVGYRQSGSVPDLYSRHRHVFSTTPPQSAVVTCALNYLRIHTFIQAVPSSRTGGPKRPSPQPVPGHQVEDEKSLQASQGKEGNLQTFGALPQTMSCKKHAVGVIPLLIRTEDLWRVLTEQGSMSFTIECALTKVIRGQWPFHFLHCRPTSTHVDVDR
jgi:hypothetical protein